jgi:hypothetical protein
VGRRSEEKVEAKIADTQPWISPAHDDRGNDSDGKGERERVSQTPMGEHPIVNDTETEAEDVDIWKDRAHDAREDGRPRQATSSEVRGDG